MAPIRTEKKNITAKGLAAFGLTRTPKKATITNGSDPQANPSSPASSVKAIETSRNHGMAEEKTSVPNAVPSVGASNAPPTACTIPQSSTPPTAPVNAASILMSEAKRKLPKPVGKGGEGVSYGSNRPDDPTREWEVAHEQELGTSTKRLTFGCSFKLADKHIQDIVDMGPKSCAGLKDFVFQYTDVDYDAHNDASGLTINGLKLLTRQCPNLRKLSLPGTSSHGDASLLHLLTHLPHLTYLELTDTISARTGLSSQVFATLHAQPNVGAKLKKLRITDCDDKSWMKAMKEMSKGRPKLTVELVTSMQFKKDGWWQMDVHYDSWKAGRKMQYTWRNFHQPDDEY